MIDGFLGDVKNEDLPDNVREEITTEERIKKIISDRTYESIVKKGDKDFLNIVIAPPRMFPSLEWFAWISQFDFWIPILSCRQSADWLNVVFRRHGGLYNIPLNEEFNWIDGWNYDESVDLYAWLDLWTKKLRKKLRDFKNKDEAEEILSTQINLSIKDLEVFRSWDEVEGVYRRFPALSGLLVKSCNRIGTGGAVELKEWPLFIWPNDIKFDSKFIEEYPDIDVSEFSNLPDTPVSCMTNQEITDLFVKPVYLFLSAMNPNSSIRIHLDGASVSNNGEISKFYNYSDVNHYDFNVYSDSFMNFEKRSVLVDIAEFGLYHLSERYSKSILHTILEI